MTQSIYVYGVINSDEKKEFTPAMKASSGAVYTIPHQDIACVVSNHQESSFDNRTREKAAKELISHQTVVENVMKEFSIIPIKFGTTLENADEVRRILERGYSEFKETLEDIDNKIELDVVAVWDDLDSVIKKIGEENREIRKFKEEIAKKSSADTFQERVKIGSMIKDILDKKRCAFQREMLEFLYNKVKIDESKKHVLMADQMVLNCAFLLDRDRENEFDQALRELNERYKERMNFRCVGPLPLYSFFTFEVKKVDFDDIDKAKKLLGLGEEVNALEIKTSYRRLARDRHPDRFPDDIDAQQKFEEIQSAYKMLLNYCQDERTSLRKDDIEGSYIINIFDIEDLQ
jgi:hypothetical protein